MRPVARAIAGRLDAEGTCRLVPVPTTPARLRERGFNQALDLAEALGARLGLPVEKALLRDPGGGRQASGGAAARGSNVLGRFRASANLPTEGAVLIVDDVLTTGATVGACARALREAGFARIGALTFARTLRTP